MVVNKRLYNFVIVPLVVLLSGFIRSVCVRVFITPYNFTPGGSTGIATLIEYATDGKFSAGWGYLIINAPLLVIAFIFIGKGFTLKTGMAIAIASVGMLLMDKYNFPSYEGGEPVLAAAASGVLGGIGLALMLRIGGSTGGSDIIAVCIQKKLSATNVSWFIYGIDATIVFSSYFVINEGLTPVLMSLIEMFCLAMMGDVIMSGFKSALKYEIITKDPEALSQELLTKLKRGVTRVNVMGMYSHDEKYMLICIIRKHQLSDFNKILQQYPDTFAYLSNTREVMGLGFSRYEALAQNAGVGASTAVTAQAVACSDTVDTGKTDSDGSGKEDDNETV